MRSVRLKISGFVQGVFFRAQAKLVADELGIVGFVRNQKDGSVVIEASAESHLIDGFIDWCKKGPDRSRVQTVTVEELSSPVTYKDFQVAADE